MTRIAPLLYVQNFTKDMHDCNPNLSRPVLQRIVKIHVKRIMDAERITWSSCTERKINFEDTTVFKYWVSVQIAIPEYFTNLKKSEHGNKKKTN